MFFAHHSYCFFDFGHKFLTLCIHLLLANGINRHQSALISRPGHQRDTNASKCTVYAIKSMKTFMEIKQNKVKINSEEMWKRKLSFCIILM